jgi:hypothetical protein
MPTIINGIEASNPFEAADRRLMTEFALHLATVPLAEVVEYAPQSVRYGRAAERDEPLRQPLEAYQLVSMLPKKQPNLRSSSGDMTGAQYDLPDGVQEDYCWNTPEGTMLKLGYGNLDARSGVGLAFNGMLIAVGAGYIRPYRTEDKNKPELVVNQLQGWVQDKYHPEYTPGLRGGFYWRDTLLHVWERIAVGVGAAVISTPDKKAHPYNIDHGPSARRRGFTHQPAAGQWEKPLS